MLTLAAAPQQPHQHHASSGMASALAAAAQAGEEELESVLSSACGHLGLEGVGDVGGSQTDHLGSRTDHLGSQTDHMEAALVAARVLPKQVSAPRELGEGDAGAWPDLVMLQCGLIWLR